MQKEIALFTELMETFCHKLNKEYLKNMNKLIEDIAVGENLDINMLKTKYLKKSNDIKNISDDETILEKKIIDGKYYYYENIENGIVYNSSSEKVGVMKNNEILFNVS